MLQERDSTDTGSISPFVLRGDVSQSNRSSARPERPEQSELPENNRHRHFREIGNWAELATGATGSASICFLFRLLSVAPAGYFVAALVAHSYFLVSATSDERKSITHLMTGVATVGSAIATLGEPASKWGMGQSELHDYHNDYQQLYPNSVGDSNPLMLSGALLLIFVACIMWAKGNK